jgi:hypothetical protein
MGLGTSPRKARDASMRGSEIGDAENSACVWGCSGLSNSSSLAAISTIGSRRRGNATGGADSVCTGAKFAMKCPYLQQWRHTVFLRRSDGRTSGHGERTR